MSGRSEVTGYVLAGGRSSRMGSDKAMLRFRGRPMMEIAQETLSRVCDRVAISGNRPDLASWGEVVTERRIAEGPAAGIEAALEDSKTPWALILPVDLPVMSATLLQQWTPLVMASEGILASYMECAGDWHPALCLVHRDCLPLFRAALDAGDRKLTRIFQGLEDRLLVVDAEALMPGAAEFFINVNTPEELVAAEATE